MKNQSILKFIILAICLLGVVADASPVCRICGKSISGQYIEFTDGSIYCGDCAVKFQRCDICGKPSTSLAFSENKRICSDCLGKIPRCDFCGEPLAGRYEQYPDINLKICAKCAATVPKCDICGRPDKNLIRAGDKKICEHCRKIAALCHICSEPLIGPYFNYEGDPSRKYCPACVDKYQHCADCDAPAGPHGMALADGRMLCPDCYQTALFDGAQVKQIKLKVLAFLDAHLGMLIKHEINYSLQGKDFISQKSDKVSGDLNGLFFRKGDEFDIYILYGLRQKDLYGVLAHEIAHAWVSENCSRDLSLEDNEGFAQWTAYHSLGYFGYEDHRKLLTTGDDVYAAGLRKMLAIERKVGRAGVFEYINKP